MVIWLHYFQACSEAETPWQKGVMEQNCLPLATEKQTVGARNGLRIRCLLQKHTPSDVLL
jgi:hypothetical protein